MILKKDPIPVDPTTVLSFRAASVTGSHEEEFSVDSDLPVSDVASWLADRFSYPTDTPYGLRDDRSSAFLDDRAAIGRVLEPDAHVTLVPRARLG